MCVCVCVCVFKYHTFFTSMQVTSDVLTLHFWVAMAPHRRHQRGAAWCSGV